MKNTTLIFPFLICLMATLAYGQAQGINCDQSLNKQQEAWVETGKSLLGGTEKRIVSAITQEINATSCPTIQALMFEAMARTYADLIREYDLTDEAARERLYHKVQMNMAFLQFTGEKGKEDHSSLNRLIRRKLKGYLPQGILTHPDFYINPFE